MDAIQTLLDDFKNKKIDADQLQDQLATALEPNIASQTDLDQQVTTLKDNYQLPEQLADQTWDSVKTIVAESLSEKNNAKNGAKTVLANNNATRVMQGNMQDNMQDNIQDNDKTIVHPTHGPAHSEVNSANRNDAETIVAIHTSDSSRTSGTKGTVGTRQEHTHNYLDSSRRSSKPVNLKPGSILKNRFILEKELGHGGMSVVYRALDLRKQEASNRNPYIAIKLLGDAFKNHPQSIRVLEHETQKIQSLAHPNIITVYDFDRDGDAIYMTMECLEGQSLDVVIHEHKNGVVIEEALPIIQSMGRALFYAHSKNIIHSDLKPENVYITKDNIVKVLDFGIARAKKMPEQNQAAYADFDGSDLGALTPPYASPEMFENADPDQRDDIYALGCVTYKLLTGQHPFNNKQANHARDEGMVLKKINQLSRKQWHTLAGSLAFNRDQRIPTIADFLDGMIPKKRTWWFYAGIAGTSIALGVSGYAWYSASQKPTLPVINLSFEQKQKITGYFETADVYLGMGYLASPPGDSAFDQYQKVLEIDPTNQAAIAGKKKIANRYKALALQKMNTAELEESLLLIKTGLIVEPDNKDLLNLQVEIRNKLTKK